MRRRTRNRAAVAAAATASALLAPGAVAAQRTVPEGFFGTNWDGEIAHQSSAKTRESNWARMPRKGVESVRATFLWSAAQPYGPTAPDFAQSDELVRLAAKNGLRLLPVVASPPRWARRADAPNSPPRVPKPYVDYLRALIGRYGPTGIFWSEHPALRKRAIRVWQIFNEPSANYQWTVPEGEDWAPSYGRVLRAAYRAVKAADPEARVVLAGLPNFSYRDLGHLYDAGDIHGQFDVAAVHPYTARKHGVLTIARRFKDVMKKHGDGGKQLWVTELGLPASKGKSSDPSAIQTDDAGMARFLEESYKDLAANRKALNLRYVHWYTWASTYNGWIFNYTGLRRYDRQGPNEVQYDKPALAAYGKLARRLEGR